MQPRRADLDMNQHVNNVAYIGWVLEVSSYSFFTICVVLLFLFLAVSVHFSVKNIWKCLFLPKASHEQFVLIEIMPSLLTEHSQGSPLYA